MVNHLVFEISIFVNLNNNLQCYFLLPKKNLKTRQLTWWPTPFTLIIESRDTVDGECNRNHDNVAR